jgi:hypothetical protein
MARTKTAKQASNEQHIDHSDEQLVDYDKIVSIQLLINQHLYKELSLLYKELQGQVDIEQATSILVSSMSTNLGILLAQIKDDSRNTYINIATNIMQQAILQTIEKLGEQSYGQIGHA